MAETLDLSLYVKPRGPGLSGMDFVVEGVNCGGCIGRIERAVRTVPGIAEARLNFTNRRLSVAWQDRKVAPAAIIETLQRLGYGAHPFAPRAAEDEEAARMKWLLRCLAVAGFAAMNIMLLSVSVWSGNVTDITPETRDLFHWVSALIALPASAYAGQPFFRSAWAALKARSVNMDVPISLGVLLALGMSLVETMNHAEHAYFDSAVMLLFFLLCGRVMDHAMRRRTRAVAGNLAALRAETAHRLDPDGELKQVPAAMLQPGDTILLKPGERMPADGAVISGSSEIDESLVTGETTPRAVAQGQSIHAGSLNFSGTLTLRITAVGERTLIDEIERLLEKAVHAKSRYVQLADRAASCYAPVVHTAAALTLAGWLLAGASAHDAIVIAISVLIITCPCALALAVPAVQVVAAGRTFRNGLFLNSGDAIERLAEADVVVFDKTGTLTLPEPRLANASSVEPGLLERAARLGLSSRHPLAEAVARAARERRPYRDAIEEPGRGVRALIGGTEARLGSAEFCGLDALLPQDRGPGVSTIAFRHGGQTAVFEVTQRLRPDAVETAAALRQRGLTLCVLSGDRVEAVAPVAARLGIADFAAGLKPANKVAALEAMKARGHRVLMVGDGINDAPALAAAHVSLSPISAADLSQAHADAVFLGEKLGPVESAIATARRARAVMRQNLWLAAIYNAIAVPIAVTGLVTPLIAAAAMSGSSILVTLNALRLRSPSGRRKAAAAPAGIGRIKARTA